jgi:4-amino-4-deoxy-L-arabinose transferase-like glycosyltransferase
MGKKGTHIKHLIVLLLFAYVFFFHGLGAYSLKEPDEGRYAEIPREMIELGDYLVPHLNYVRYFEKPPLLYWAVSASYQVLGTDEWGFRFPNALAAFLTVLALYLGVRWWIGKEVALLSSIILISSFGFFAMARIVTTDMLFTFWLFLCLLSFYGYYKENRAYLIYLFYGSLGCATLTKGPVAVMLMGVTVLCFLITEKNLSFLKRLRWTGGILIYALITVPWFLAVSVREKEFFYFFFIDQHILRFLTAKHRRSGPLYYFVPVVFGGMFPWSFFIPRAVVSLWQRNEIRLFLIWSGVVFLFFSLSGSKLPPYIVPIFPALSIVLGAFFHEKWGQPASRLGEVLLYGALFLGLSASLVLYSTGILNSLLGRVSTEAKDIIGGLKWFIVGVSTVSFTAFCLLCTRRLTNYSRLFPVLTIFSFLIVLLLLCNLGTVDRLNTAKKLGTAINRYEGRVDYIVNYGSYEQTLPFYTRRRVTVASYRGELAMGSRYEDAKPFFIDDQEFIYLFRSSKRVLVVVKGNRLARLQERLHGEIKIVERQGERYLISN